MCLTRHRDYEATPGAIGAARDFISAFAVAMLDPRGWSVADDAALLVSELVTSAVAAGCSHVDVLADLHSDRMDVVITGHGSRAAAAPSPQLRQAVLQHLPEWEDLAPTPAGALVGGGRLGCEPGWTAAVPCAESHPPD